MTFAKTTALAGALLLTAACATPFTADVSRFQRLPAPTGQTYAIVAMGDEETESLEFQTYARYVAGQMNAQGYREVRTPDNANLVVSLDYGVGQARERIRSRPGFHGGFGFRRFGGFGRFGRFGRFGGFGRGFGGFGGFGGGFGGANVYSFTVYNPYLDMTIKRRDGEFVFEGRAESTTRTDNLPEIVPQLVAAMFTDFPGGNGVTTRVKVPTRDS
ncbi:MAG: DUF4136 domain-containing protein [Pseudomonadota bacterium]